MGEDSEGVWSEEGSWVYEGGVTRASPQWVLLLVLVVRSAEEEGWEREQRKWRWSVRE